MRQRSFEFKSTPRKYKYTYKVVLTDSTLQPMFVGVLLRNIINRARPCAAYRMFDREVHFDADISPGELGDIMHALNISKAEITQTEYPNYDLEEIF